MLLSGREGEVLDLEADEDRRPPSAQVVGGQRSGEAALPVTRLLAPCADLYKC